LVITKTVVNMQVNQAFGVTQNVQC